DIKRSVRRTQTTHWDADPWTLGAFSSAAPGSQGARRILMEPVRERIFLAGEAIHETMWGTVGGAWESGERAADFVLRRIAGLPDPVAPKPEPEPAPTAARRGQSKQAEAAKPEEPRRRGRGQKKAAPPKPAPRARRRRTE